MPKSAERSAITIGTATEAPQQQLQQQYPRVDPIGPPQRLELDVEIQHNQRIGFRVLVMGPDGSGKSTIAEQLVYRLRQEGLRVRHCHFLPAHKATPLNISVVANPHALEARGLTQFAAVALRLVKYWRSALTPEGDLSLRSADVVVQERGWIDQGSDPIRYRLTPLGAAFARKLVAYTPRTEGVVICAGEPNVMVARKPEISTQETASQLRRIEGSTRDSRRVILDTTSDTVANCVATAESFVLDLRARRIQMSLRPVHPRPSRLGMLASPNSWSAASALYQPQSKRGRLVRRVRLRTGTPSESSQSALVGLVMAQSGIPADAVASIRSTGRDRIVFAVMRKGHVSEFVKVAWTDRDQLAAEAEIIAAVQGCGGFRAPQVIGFTERDGWSALRLEPVPGKPNARRLRLDDVVSVAIALSQARGCKGVLHGDLAPWNLLRGDPPGLVDWEQAGFDDAPGADLVHFVAVSMPGRRHQARVRAAFERYSRETRLDLNVEAMIDQIALFDKAAWDAGRKLAMRHGDSHRGTR